ncbi:PREDICTED: uncharacterized protein LOC109338919 [Lupinus angustifolius]|uniref:uncharacterized protein LOC109338919 n=1 Tax=Lupinus angustifolius TaxID=3871 RepID=UPI00092F6E9A|nr:PREDICTED: uncharacterized protein LOC109338919 [Lupinus angustifolius]
MTKILSLTNQMRSCGEEIKEQTMVEKVLRTLTPKYDHIVVVVEESKNLEDYKVEELQGSLEAHELRLKEGNLDKGGEHDLQARFNKSCNVRNFYVQWNKKSKGKMQNNRWRKSEQVSSSRKSEHTMIKGGTEPVQIKNSYKNSDDKRYHDKQKLQCYNYRGYGHFASECKVTKWSKRKEDEVGLAQEEKSNESDDDHCLLMATTRSNQDKTENVDFWYLDTVSAEGIGTVMIQRNDERKSYISRVFYVPKMKNNLLSLGQLLEKGYTMEMKNGMLNVFDRNNQMILKTPLSSNMTFKIQI